MVYRSLLVLVLSTLPGTAAILHVLPDSPGGNDGASWETAYDTLTSALAAAAAGDEIWVARGTYHPAAAGDRSATFLLPEGVALYGGFGGYETNRAWHVVEPAFNRTILSGDLAGDDAQPDGGQEDNVYHVVTSNGNSSATILDGFTIEGGRADGSEDSAQRGAGILAIDSDARFRRLLIRANEADSLGGGVAVVGGSPRFIEITFLRNRSANFGGGLTLQGNGTEARFTNCRFIYNTGRLGGGFYAMDNLQVDFRNTTFVHNHGFGEGGAFFATGGPTVLLEHVTITGNLGTSLKEAFVLAGGANVTARNSIIWGNGPDEAEFRVNPGTTFTAEASWIRQDGAPDPGFWDLKGEDGSFGTSDDEPRLRGDSPALGTALPIHLSADLDDLDGDGDFDESLPMDLAGAPRVQGSPDPGAYEWNVVFVDRASVAANPDGLTWATAYPDLHDGLAAAQAREEVWIAQGVYRPAEPDGPRGAFYAIPDGARVFGGFAGTEGARTDRPAARTEYATILSGDLNGDDTSSLLENVEDNSHTVVKVKSSEARVLLQGLTISGGNTGSQGGGLEIDDLNHVTHAHLRFIRFIGNQASSAGGALVIRGTGQTVAEHCRFEGNYSRNVGGAVTVFQPYPEFYNCTFVGNSADNQAGAIFANGDFNNGPTFPVLVNCTFAANEARSAPVYSMGNDSTAALHNTIIWGHANPTSSFRPAPSAASSDSNLIEGGSSSLPNTIDADPRWVRAPDSGDGDWKTLEDNDYGDLRLWLHSPAVDAGQSVFNPLQNDLAGELRLQDGAINLGAHEGPLPYAFSLLYPDLEKEGDENGDGVSNYLQYALGFEPAETIPEDALPRLVTGPGPNGLASTYRVFSSDVRLVIWRSTDLSAWQPLQAKLDYLPSEIDLEDPTRRGILAEFDVAPTDGAATFWRTTFLPDTAD